MRFEDIATGQALPALAIPITVPLIAGGAIATRDYFPGHHDLEAARALGSPHIFMNILTTSALVQRFVEEWAGAGAEFKSVKIKLGEVSAVDAASRCVDVSLKGKNSMGNHVTGTVRLHLPSPRP